MKIAILTQPLKSNYGCVLQAYALQTVLGRMGHDVEIIKREYPKPSLRVRLKNILRFVHTLFFKYVYGKSYLVLSNPFKIEYTYLPISNVYQFIYSYIKQSRAIYTTDELDKYFKVKDFDVYIVGSDQVWRPRYSPCIANYFLDSKSIAVNAKRIAYAASFGTSEWEYSKEQTILFSNLAVKFDSISVREDSGIKLCEEFLKVKAVHVLDPTMLLNISDYISLIDKINVDKNEIAIACYILDDTEEKRSIISEVAAYFDTIPFYSNPHIVSNNYVQLSIEEWLNTFRRAKFIIVDSFHGCVFSILFQKPFIVIGNKARGISRFESLLKMFNLQYRMVMSVDDFIDRKEKLLTNAIDYEYVQSVIIEERKKSISFLKDSMKK